MLSFLFFVSLLLFVARATVYPSNMCYAAIWNEKPSGGDVKQLFPLRSGDVTAANYYSYDKPQGASANTPHHLEVSDTVNYFFYDSGKHTSLFLIFDIFDDPTGGSVSASLTSTGLAGKGTTQEVGDDPGEQSWDGVKGTGSFSTAWAPCCTDGMVIGKLPRPPTTPVGTFNPEDYEWCINMKFKSSSGVNKYIIRSMKDYWENGARITNRGESLITTSIGAKDANTLRLCYTQCACIQNQKMTANYGKFDSHQVIFGKDGGIDFYRPGAVCSWVFDLKNVYGIGFYWSELIVDPIAGDKLQVFYNVTSSVGSPTVKYPRASDSLNWSNDIKKTATKIPIAPFTFNDFMIPSGKAFFNFATSKSGSGKTPGFQLYYVAVPLLSSLSIKAAIKKGGEVVIVTGNNFINNAAGVSSLKCKFGDFYVVNAVYVSSTQVKCTVPTFGTSKTNFPYISIANDGGIFWSNQLPLDYKNDGSEPCQIGPTNLSGLNGKFNSFANPKGYPAGSLCSWKVSIPPQGGSQAYGISFYWKTFRMASNSDKVKFYKSNPLPSMKLSPYQTYTPSGFNVFDWTSLISAQSQASSLVPSLYRNLQIPDASTTVVFQASFSSPGNKPGFELYYIAIPRISSLSPVKIQDPTKGATITIKGSHFVKPVTGEKGFLACKAGNSIFPAKYVDSSTVTCALPVIKDISGFQNGALSIWVTNDGQAFSNRLAVAQEDQICGDGKIVGAERCDDGNKVSGDGCSSICKIEDGWTCPTPGRPCVDINECVTVKCVDAVFQKSVTCKDSVSSPKEVPVNKRKCTCANGLYLKNTDPAKGVKSADLVGTAPFIGCSDIDECALYRCQDPTYQNRITCKDSLTSKDINLDSRTCTCGEGLYIKNTDMQKNTKSVNIVAAGSFPGCADVDECALYKCADPAFQSFVTCTDSLSKGKNIPLNARTCTCGQGLYLKGSDVSKNSVAVTLPGSTSFVGCADINECALYGCGTTANCVESNGAANADMLGYRICTCKLPGSQILHAQRDGATSIKLYGNTPFLGCGGICGNAVKTADEECDDGNFADGDGCTEECKLERGWQCGEPGQKCCLELPMMIDQAVSPLKCWNGYWVPVN